MNYPCFMAIQTNYIAWELKTETKKAMDSNYDFKVLFTNLKYYHAKPFFVNKRPCNQITRLQKKHPKIYVWINLHE